MLYIVATPIGSLDDLSFHQAKTIISSDIILAEDTRSGWVLVNACLSRYKLKPGNYKLVSYYKENEMKKLPQILQFLKEGKKVSLISESGMPLICDPGYLLIKSLIREKIPFKVVPGPSALTTAAAYCGFKTDNILFTGYLPKKSGQLTQLINQLKQVKKLFNKIIFIAFDSPYRINKTLAVFANEIPQADIVICRELTKKFEEIIRGKPKDLLQRSYKGEITLVISI